MDLKNCMCSSGEEPLPTLGSVHQEREQTSNQRASAQLRRSKVETFRLVGKAFAARGRDDDETEGAPANSNMEGERFQDIPVSLAMSTQKMSEVKIAEDKPESSSAKEEASPAVPKDAPEKAAPEPPPARPKATKRGSSEDTANLGIEQPEINMQQYPPHDDLDIEIDKLVYVVEDHAHTLKKSLVNRYMGMRKKWHDHEIQRIEDEKKVFEQELVLKQMELDKEKYAVHVHKTAEAKARKVTLKSIGLIFIANQRLKNFSTCANFFKIWREIPKKRRLFHKSIDRIKTKIANQMMRKHFQVWRRWTRETVRTRIEEVIFQRFERKFNDERLDLQGQIAAYKAELEYTQKQLEDAVAAREKIEKDMKQSFMRGLCAMNIEAMSMMKKGSFTSIASIIPPDQPEET